MERFLIRTCLCVLVTAGHPQEASGERSDRAADSDRGPLHPEAEGRGGAHRSR